MTSGQSGADKINLSVQRSRDLFATVPQPWHQCIKKRAQLRRRMPAVGIKHMDRRLGAFVLAHQPDQRPAGQRVDRLVAQHASDCRSVSACGWRIGETLIRDACWNSVDATEGFTPEMRCRGRNEAGATNVKPEGVPDATDPLRKGKICNPSLYRTVLLSQSADHAAPARGVAFRNALLRLHVRRTTLNMRSTARCRRAAREKAALNSGSPWAAAPIGAAERGKYIGIRTRPEP